MDNTLNNSNLNVFIPAPKDENPWIDEIMKYSDMTFEFGRFDDDVSDFDIILINWPEQIFGWYEPNDEQLEKFEFNLLNWKKTKPIIYAVHNERRHIGMTPNLNKLYDLILVHCHVMIHFGKFSLTKYKMLFKNAIHKYIPHPLYVNSFHSFEKEVAREKLGLKKKQKIVVVPGRIRNMKERRLIIKGFKSLRLKNKFLAVPYMYKNETQLEFKGRMRLKKYIDVKQIIEYFKNRPFFLKYFFGFQYANTNELSLWLSAADVVMIPRVDTLNSGNLFLGLTFKKIVVGPNIGNIGEFLDLFEMPKFEPIDLTSVTMALQAGFELVDSFSYNKKNIHPFYPENVATEWDNLFTSTYNNYKRF